MTWNCFKLWSKYALRFTKRFIVQGERLHNSKLCNLDVKNNEINTKSHSLFQTASVVFINRILFAALTQCLQSMRLITNVRIGQKHDFEQVFYYKLKSCETKKVARIMFVDDMFFFSAQLMKIITLENKTFFLDANYKYNWLIKIV